MEPEVAIIWKAVHSGVSLTLTEYMNLPARTSEIYLALKLLDEEQKTKARLI